MTDRLYLHVGAPKSGTTYVQGVLERNRQRLAESGVLVVGERRLDRVHAAMVVREDPRLEALPERSSSAWQRLVAQVKAWPGPTAVLSYELFAGASAEQVRRALSDLEGIEVHVVITARDFARSVPSAWQERLKFALVTPLERWRPRGESAGPRAEWAWRTMDPAGVARRWGASLPAQQVHVVTVPRETGSMPELWSRFAAATGLQGLDLELSVDRANESLGLVEAELLRRVNERLRPPIQGNREHSLWLRDTLAHRVLAGIGSEPIGLTDEQFAEARERAQAAVDTIVGAGYDVRGDLSDLEATRLDARTPGQASEAELLDSALEAIVRLLLLVREGSRGAASAPHGGSRKFLRGGALRRWAATGRDPRRSALEERIAGLEAQVLESRRLHLRVAELADVVSELLLRPDAADGKVTVKALRAYREKAL